MAAVSLAFGLLCTDARAESPADGTWKQGPLVETFTVQQWLAGCGPVPTSSRTGGGETAIVREEGDDLVISSGGRVFRTNECYDPMPNLRRETHSRDASGKTWRTRCTTPANDPRKATLNTLVARTSDKRIDLVETGRYEVTLDTGRCMADVKRTRAFDLVAQPAGTPAAVATQPRPENAPKPAVKTSACSAPGAPTRLEVRPSRKLLRTGETFTFHARVTDDKGCATTTPTVWRLATDGENKGVTVDKGGQVSVATDAREGSIELIATAAGKSTRVVVDVSEPAHYDALLAQSGLNAAGESEGASVVALDAQSIGAGESVVEDHARSRRLVFIAIVSGVLVVLGAVAALLWRRSRRAAALERDALERHEARVREAMETRKRREAEHAAQQLAHERSVAEAERQRVEQRTQPVDPAPSLTCPVCRRSWDDGTTFCPHDGARLGSSAEAAVAIAATGGTARKRGKICPTCGERFDGVADFCGKDGTQLVLLN